MTRAGTDCPSSKTGLPGVAATAGAATVTFPVAVWPAVVAGLAGVPFGLQTLFAPGTISHCKTKSNQRVHTQRLSKVFGRLHASGVSGGLGKPPYRGVRLAYAAEANSGHRQSNA